MEEAVSERRKAFAAAHISDEGKYLPTIAVLIADMFYQPMMAEALREGTTLNRFRECVSEKSQEVGAKEIFVHFIRGKIVLCWLSSFEPASLYFGINIHSTTLFWRPSTLLNQRSVEKRRC